LGDNIDMSSDGNYLIAGSAYGANKQAYVYDYNSSSSQWVKRTTLSHPNPTDASFYGASVAISDDGNTVAVGASSDDVDGTDFGRAYVYTWSGSAWSSPTILSNPQPTTSDTFGSVVSISGDGTRLIVAASREDNGFTDNGQVYTYEYYSGSWQLRQPMASIGAVGLGNNTHLGEYADGCMLSRDGSTIVVGDYAGVSKVRVFNMPSNIKSIWGSNDDVNWTKITTGNETFRGNDRLEFKNLDNPNYYKYHAIVADAFTQLKDVKLYGIRNRGSSTLHDGTLTLTKNLSVGGDASFGGLVVTGTGGTTLGGGTTAQRPTYAPLGSMRYNTDTGYMEAYTGTGWGALATPPSIFSISPLSTLSSGGAVIGTVTQQKVVASDDAAQDGFGLQKTLSMSNDGNHIIIGAPGLSSNDGQDEKGSAYYFLKSGTTWSEQQILQPSDPLIDTNFGVSVAISGNGLYTAIGRCDTGSTNQSNNAVYIFKLESGTWVQKQKLGLPSGFHATASRFGTDVSLTTAGDCLIVGTGYYSGAGGTAPGGAVVYNRTNESWAQESALLSGSTVTADEMGMSVKISGDGNYAIVGARMDDDQGLSAGTAHIFKRATATTWDSGFKITGSDIDASDRFGFSVSIDSTGTYAIVGAYYHADGMPGGAYIFYRSGSTNSWSQQADLVATNISSGDMRYGWEVEISPDGLTALVSSQDSTVVTSGGAVHRWTRSGSTWTEQAAIRSSDAASSDFFGKSISCSSDASYIVAGAPNDDDGGTNSGSAYIITTFTAENQVFDSSTQVFTVSGASFDPGLAINLVGADGTNYEVVDRIFVNATTTTFKMGDLSSATAQLANRPYKVKVTGGSGLAATSTATIGFVGLSWTSPAAGATLSTFATTASANNTELAATDDVGGSAVTFSVPAANLPSGLTLNGSTGAITGTIGAVSTTSVTFRVTDNASGATLDRTFIIVGLDALYAFSSHTFIVSAATTNQLGSSAANALKIRTGPTFAEMKTAYNTTVWYNNTAWFNEISGKQGFQLWTIPKSGTYRITAKGAMGGLRNGGTYANTPGRGAVVRADIAFTMGTKIVIIAGQQAPKPYGSASANSGTGGGGATWVLKENFTTSTNDVYMVAGGGGGTGSPSNNSGQGGDASTSSQGVLGPGGAYNGSYGGGGAGWTSDGQGPAGGKSPHNGAIGGLQDYGTVWNAGGAFGGSGGNYAQPAGGGAGATGGHMQLSWSSASQTQGGTSYIMPNGTGGVTVTNRTFGPSNHNSYNGSVYIQAPGTF
jgi:hypothetical protein